LAADEKKPVLPATRAETQALLDEIDRDDRCVIGAGGVAALLARLQGHYHRPDLGTAQLSALYEDYIEDLRDLPEGILMEAIRDYRRDPASKFFPKVGELIEFVRLAERRRCRARFNLQRALVTYEAYEEPELPSQDRRKELADYARKVAAGFGIPREFRNHD